MKKIAIVTGLGMLLFTSCVKEYTCQCTFTDSSPSMPLDDAVTETVIIYSLDVSSIYKNDLSFYFVPIPTSQVNL